MGYVLPEDFRLHVGRYDQGTFVRVVHVPTGVARTVTPIGETPPVDVTREAIREMLPSIPAWVSWPDGLTNALRGLIDEAKTQGGERGELARDHDALPVTPDLWSWVLLRDNGIVVKVTEGSDANGNRAEVIEQAEPQLTARVLALAEHRFPALAEVAPSAPSEASRCEGCTGVTSLEVV